MSVGGTILTLLLGAIGAVAAILLKEAVQQALERRAIAWQLFGYVLAWQKQIVRLPPLFAVYQKVKDREASLRASMRDGTAAFSQQLLQQTTTRDDVRKKLREGIISALEEAKFDALGSNFPSVVKGGLAQVTQQRRDLMDGKSFILDKDAAVLGRAFAFNVVQFRVSLCQLFLCVESLPAVLEVEESHRGALLAQVIDQLVLHGEDFFESLLRLERGIDRASKLPLWRLTWEVFSPD